MIECPHGDDYLLCPPCQRSNERPKKISAWRESSVFKANYDGKCGDCGEPFYQGDWVIQFTRGETKKYHHAECER